MIKKEISITEYLDTDYHEYAKYVIENRAIPSVIDGLKPTHRKVIYIADKVWRNGSEKPLKIFQLSGKVAADAHYHHGDASLSGAIVGMAQKFKNSMLTQNGFSRGCFQLRRNRSGSQQCQCDGQGARSCSKRSQIPYHQFVSSYWV